MISLLISREFRFDFGLTEKEMDKLLQAANKKHENIEYANKNTAKAICNSIMKLLLTKNLFYREFNYRRARECYLDGNHVSVQLEDCADTFCTLFDKEKYLLVFELDHSQAYKQYSDDAFTLLNFNLGPRGSVPKV